MIFEYRDYYQVLFLLPVAVAVPAGAMLLGTAWKIIRNLVTKEDLIGPVFCAGVLLALLLPQIRFLYHGGMYLPAERNAELSTVSGCLEEIVEPSERFPGFKTNHRFGADVVIDGQTYFAVTAEGLAAGENVTIQVLPRSRCILEIQAS